MELSSTNFLSVVFHCHTTAKLLNTLEASVGASLHELREKYPGDFALLCDAFLGLLPDIERMELRQEENQWEICY